MKSLIKVSVALLFVGGIYSFTSDKTIEEKAIQLSEGKSIIFETNDADELKRFDINRFSDVLSRENWNEINEVQKIALFKIKITVKGKGNGTDIDIQGE